MLPSYAAHFRSCVSYSPVDNLKCEYVWFNSVLAVPLQKHGKMEH